MFVMVCVLRRSERAFSSEDEGDSSRWVSASGPDTAIPPLRDAVLQSGPSVRARNQWTHGELYVHCQVWCSDSRASANTPPNLRIDEAMFRARLERMADDKLIERWLNGDAQAGDEIACRYRAVVAHFAMRRYHLDPDTAEDVTQVTFERLHKALPSFEGRASLETFVLSIARRACLDLRRGREGTRQDRDRPLDDAAPIPDPKSDPALKAGLSADLERCLEELTKRAREVFMTRAVAELSYEELGAQLGVPAGSVGRVISEARKALQECLQRED